MHCIDSTENEDDGFAVGKAEGWAQGWRVGVLKIATQCGYLAILISSLLSIDDTLIEA